MVDRHFLCWHDSVRVAFYTTETTDMFHKEIQNNNNKKGFFPLRHSQHRKESSSDDFFSVLTSHSTMMNRGGLRVFTSSLPGIEHGSGAGSQPELLPTHRSLINYDTRTGKLKFNFFFSLSKSIAELQSILNESEASHGSLNFSQT